MKIKLCDLSPDLAKRLPQFTDDKSGIGVHYVDAYLKAMNVTLSDGRVVKGKRRGLKLLLSVDERKGEGLLRRIVSGPDPMPILDAALQEAAKAAGIALVVEDGALFLGDDLLGDGD